MSGYVFLLTGGAGTGKTATALSGEGETGYFEFDPNSFNRATSGINIDQSRIHVHHLPAPVDALWDIGSVQMSNAGGIAPTATRSLKGWLEQYSAFLDCYSHDLASEKVQQVVMDTETRLWLITRNAWQQQMQEAQRAANKSEVARMEPLKYTEANSRYQMIVDAPAVYGKHLVLVSHLKAEYIGDSPTGRMIHDGNKEAPNNADLQLEFLIKDRRPVAIIRKSLGHLDLVGLEIKEPTIPGLVAILNGIKVINNAGLELPRDDKDKIDLKAVVELAESLA